MKELWIGRRYLGELRECTLLDRVTLAQRSFLSTEEQARAGAAEQGVTVYRTVTYDADNQQHAPAQISLGRESNQ